MSSPSMMGATMAARLAFLLVLLAGTDALRCDWGYEGHTSGPSPFDGRFTLNISVDTTGYRPNAEYDVTLQGQRKGMMTEKFIGFLIVAEGDDISDASSANEKKAGTFQIVGDSLTKYSDRCQNAVTQTSFLPKPEIQVLWIAPPPGSGCVTIKATVVEHRDVWYMDDTSLSKTICEDTSQGSSHEQPPILSKCCACYEAKYEVTFEGLWSRHTHPKDFPPNGWSTRFSDIIGASHTADYSFWKYDERASEGLKELAEQGSTNKLERELKGQSTSIRTIIKARGISYPNLTGKTFAVLRVTNEHHLMSLVSRIDPSPDWIVGISGLELCLESCTWIESMVWDLYPWDIGTDSGITYTASNHPTVPPDVIHRIGPDYPKNPESPFYDPSGKEMKPMARLNITRQRLYEKNCSDSSTSDSNGNSNSPCALTSWSAWSECSKTCGEGISTQQRSFRNLEAAEAARCTAKLTESRKCYGNRRHCRVPSEYEPDPAQNEGPCAISEWTAWSGCTKTCSRGHKVRSRKFRHKGAMKRCYQGYRTFPILQQTLPCYGTNEDCPEPDVDIFDKNDPSSPSDCPLSDWSNWSPCSVTCGTGQRERVREIMKRQYPEPKALKPDVNHALLFSTTRDDANYDEETDDVNDLKSDNANDNDENSFSDACDDVELREVAECNGTYSSCDISDSDSRKICSLPKIVGPCRGYKERWFFDVSAKTCEPFGYTGCQGNRNNFESHHECMRVCRAYKADIYKIQVGNQLKDADTLSKGTRNPNYDKNENTEDYDNEEPPRRNQLGKKKKPGPNGRHLPRHGNSNYNSHREQDEEEYVVVEKIHGNVKDCRVSEWTDWSSCSVTCGEGYEERSRTILRETWNGGRKCPDELLQKRRCNLRSCHHRKKPNTGSYGKPSHTTGRGNERYREWESPIDRDCELDEWSPWSPCTETCGPRAVKQRTRKILQAPTGNGARCEARLEKSNCQLMPCIYED